MASVLFRFDLGHKEYIVNILKLEPLEQIQSSACEGPVCYSSKLPQERNSQVHFINVLIDGFIVIRYRIYISDFRNACSDLHCAEYEIHQIYQVDYNERPICLEAVAWDPGSLVTPDVSLECQIAIKREHPEYHEMDDYDQQPMNQQFTKLG